MASVIDKKRFDNLVDSLSTVAPIFVLGDVGLDKYTYGSVHRISPEAPVPVLEVSKEWVQLGLAANISHNLIDLNVTSSMSGVIGQDDHADLFLKRLQIKGLDSSYLYRSKTRPTTYKERITTATQQVCRVDYESKELLDLSEYEALVNIISSAPKNHEALIIEDYAKGVLSEELTQHAITLFTKQGKLVTVDPARNRSPLLYKGATLLKPNLVEARSMVQFFGHEQTAPSQMAKILSDELSIEKIIITLGGEGMAILDRKVSDEVEFIPTVAQEVFDVSGAGDTVISVLTASLMAGANLFEAAWIGNCAAGVVVAKKGTATVNQQELKDFYNRFSDKF
jgi:rfaE bifunctional protein kinase chain/domain